MKKYLFVVSFFLISCVSNQTKELNSESLIFTTNMSMSEFKTKLENYVKGSSYPRLDSYE